MIDVNIEKNKINDVFLVGVFSKQNKTDFLSSLKELERLSETAALNVVSIFTQSLDAPSASTYIKKGKLSQIKNAAKEHEVRTLVFNDNLSPAQSRNIANYTKCNVVDRTELILDIFAKHAQTKQAKLQVELAQLEYNYTKLKRKWTHLSRIEGGIGFRGPGEKQIEIDRREIRAKVKIIKKKLENIKKISETKRNRRTKRKNILSLALVGYTNAGKSSLFNRLTGAGIYVKDELFATLDSTTRSVKTANINKDVVITDTIGFIRNLPHRLVDSFHTTLLEVLKADLLLHVIDFSDENWEEYAKNVESVLNEIDISGKNILTVFNKCDKIDEVTFLFEKKHFTRIYPDSVFISVKSGFGIDNLEDKIMEFIRKYSKTAYVKVPDTMQNLLQFIYKHSEILERNYDAKLHEHILKIRVAQELFSNIKKQIDTYRFEKFLNSK